MLSKASKLYFPPSDAVLCATQSYFNTAVYILKRVQDFLSHLSDILFLAYEKKASVFCVCRHITR